MRMEERGKVENKEEEIKGEGEAKMEHKQEEEMRTSGGREERPAAGSDSGETSTSLNPQPGSLPPAYHYLLPSSAPLPCSYIVYYK